MHLIIYTGSSSTAKMPALLEGIIPENQQLQVDAQQAEHLLLPAPSSSFTEVPPTQASNPPVHPESSTLTSSTQEIMQSEDTRLLQERYPSGK